MTEDERALLLAVADVLLHQGDWVHSWKEQDTLRSLRRKLRSARDVVTIDNPQDWSEDREAA